MAEGATKEEERGDSKTSKGISSGFSQKAHFRLLEVREGRLLTIAVN
jgi:hypothetical protein